MLKRVFAQIIFEFFEYFPNDLRYFICRFSNLIQFLFLNKINTYRGSQKDGQ
jgi:hypothetical protein